MAQQVPLSILRAFEAAGRTGSFSSAAVELHLTPSAVSHAIRKLEHGLGVTLFERKGRLVQLTPHGEALMLHVGRAFDDLRRGMDVVSTHAPGLLRLHSAPSFATQWLTPRLPRFLDQHPGIDIQLAAGTNYMHFQTDELDADIVYGLPRQEGFIVLPLGEETITPLCTPKLAESIHTPADLLNCPLIDGYNKHVRWSMWFGANGLTASPGSAMRFDRSHLAIAAATLGMGVVLDSTRMAERELARGQLVAPLAGRAKDIRYPFLVFPLIARMRRPLRLFIAWLESELGIAFGTY